MICWRICIRFESSSWFVAMAEESKSRFENAGTRPAESVKPAEDQGFRARHLPGTPAGEAKGMLPGMAAIAMYILFISMYTAFKMIQTTTLPVGARFSILGISTLVVIGVFGLLRLKRWGWALVSTGCLAMAVGGFYAFHSTHVAPYLVQGLFALVFFLYLSRTEVRERLR